jgi:rare lipoprotein A
MIKYLLVFLAAVLMILPACASVPRFTTASRANLPAAAEENLDRYADYLALETVYGVASYYADKYHGRITYGGEVYDMNGFSAAHPSYRMNTIVRITNLSNDKKIILRINDKMPFREDRIIDLSLGAAKELDFVRKGLTDIKLEVLEWGDGKK